jgi:hypothetical protein
MIYAYVTFFWHLPTAPARGTIKSDSRRHPQATRRQRGRAVTRGLPIRDRWPASVAASRRLTKEDRHFTALTGDRQLCAKAHAPDPAMSRGTSITRIADSRVPQDPPEIPLDRCCHTGPAKHHPSSGTTEKGK